MGDDKVGYKVFVRGIVQGVGFRYFTAQEALKLNLTGRAKNLNTGAVEVVMYGEEAQCQLLLKWLEHGPRTAVVDNINVSRIEYENKKLKKGFLAH